jgi:MFS family permease
VARASRPWSTRKPNRVPTIARHRLLQSAAGRRLAFAALYFSEGAPIGYIWWALPAKLRSAGVPIDDITSVTALLVLPWALKFLWAPLVDSVRGPRWNLAHWIVTAQCLMTLPLLPLLGLDFAAHLNWLRGLLLMHAVLAATQDVAIDALAIATITPGERGAINGWMQAGMLAGRGVFGGATLWFESRVGQDAVIVGLIACILASAIIAWRLRDAARESQEVDDAARAAPHHGSACAHFGAVARTLRKAVHRPRTWIALAFAATGGAAFEALGGIGSAFMIDAGVPRAAVGAFYATGVIIAMVVGAMLGGRLSDRFGRYTTVIFLLMALSLVVGAVGVSTIPACVASVGADGIRIMTFVLMSVFYVAVGAFTASTYAMFMDLTDPRLGGTQFSAFMGATNLCESWAAFTVGGLIAAHGYAAALATMAGLSLLSLPLLRMLQSRRFNNV